MRNFLQIIGRLTKDPERVNLNSSKMLVKGSMAYNKTKDQSFFLDIQGWDKTGERLLEFKKGDLVILSGSLDVQSWDDKDGNKRTKSVMNVTFGMRFPKSDESDLPPVTQRYEPVEIEPSTLGDAEAIF